MILDKGQKKIKENYTAHSQGTIIYTSKLRDDLKTKEGKEKLSKMDPNYLLGIAVVPWVLDDTINRTNALGNGRTIIEKRRNPKDPVSALTLNFKSNTTGKNHGVMGYNPYYFKWNPKILRYDLKSKETGELPKLKNNKIIKEGRY